MTEQGSENAARGFVYAATGETYVTLARRSARSLRQVHPDAEIDLFTDAPLDDPVFSQVHILSESWFRPKMEALIRSRFDRTMYLDADTMAIADLSPAFDVLDRFDIAICHGRFINNPESALIHTKAMPDAFVPLNCGVMAIRRSPEVLDLIQRWQAALKETGARVDQPIFRELVYDSDLRLWVLPPGYNLMSFRELRSWWGLFSAPRLLHASWLHRRREGPGDPMTPFTMEELVGRRDAVRLRALIRSDRNLTPDLDEAERVRLDPLEPPFMPTIRSVARAVRRAVKRQ